MYFQQKHVNRILKDLDSLRISESKVINNIKIMTGDVKGKWNVDINSEQLKPYAKGEKWGNTRDYSIFRANIDIPENMNGKQVLIWFDTKENGAHILRSTNNSGWNVSKNPQFVLYVNQKAYQGIDKYHLYSVLSENAKQNEHFEIALEGFPGMAKGHLEMYMTLLVLDKATDKLFYDIKVPLEAAQFIENEKDRLDILGHLEKVVGMLDLRIPYSKMYYESINQGIDYMENVFYAQKEYKPDGIVKGIGHTHIDVAWLWPVKETRQKVVRSFSSVLNLMKIYPEYKFMSSQPQLYKFLKQENIDLFNQVKQRIDEGRWEAEGGMWLEADCNLASGESFVRQIMFGKKFFKENFNVDNKILWLPDVFGYSAALPQILKKTGIEYFMTTKISWSEYNMLPYDTFNWTGIDGTKVLTHFVTTSGLKSKNSWGGYTYNGELSAEQTIGTWKNYKNKDINEQVYTTFGWGDGGGGPTREMLEEGRRLKKGIKGIPQFEIEQPLKYFNNLYNNVKDNKRLPNWVGELYLEYHRGTYTTMARNKRDNRKSELLYRDIELFSVIANNMGLIDYPQKDINDNWEVILLNQFHDILPGSSIKEVYDVTKVEYEKILSNGDKLLNDSLDKIANLATTRKRDCIVFNQLSFERQDIVEIKTNKYFTHAIDDTGKKYIGQLIEGENINTFIFEPIIPSMGYRTFELVEEKQEVSMMSANMQVLENNMYKISFNDQMNITSIFDKVNNRQVLKKGDIANQILAYEDKSYSFDAWDINIFYKDKVWPLNDVEHVEVLEQGPVRTGLKIRRKFLQSVFEQTIYIYNNTKRIDFKTYVDWKQYDILLKATFPIDVNSSKATYDIQFGNVERPTHWNTSWDYAKFEVCAHKWADLSDGGYGVSLLNDCKYGYDIKGNEMSLSLLKSPTKPNPVADQEQHYFTYSIYPHDDGFRKANTINEAYMLNCPLIAKVVEKGKGKLEKQYSFIKVDKPNIVVETVKKSENDFDTIIRLYEAFNKKTNVIITLAKKIEQVFECDLLENIEKPIDFENNKFSIMVDPFEIKTYKVKFK